MQTIRLSRIACLIATICIATAIPSSAQTFNTLVNFDGKDGNEADFVMQGNDGNIYGTTLMGGELGDGDNAGTIFEYAQDGSLTTLYNFCAQKSCADGQWPIALLQTSDGRMIGITLEGGVKSASCATGCGTIFELTQPGTVKTLHSFCKQANCPDGVGPSGLIQGVDGTLYGTTSYGGAYNHGTIFSFTPTGKFTVLYSFCSQSNCTDGATPNFGIIQGSNGALYGTTGGGGTTYGGTIFRITTGGKFTSLHSFSDPLAIDSYPNGLIQASDGNCMERHTPREPGERRGNLR
jgi:uncharacterized repeat protein (TIGR03803 family)